MILPSLDFTSEFFDPYEALHNNKVPLPYPKAKTYNNISDYYSHTFLKKRFDSEKLSKKHGKPRERDYTWYYDTLGLSENQRNLINCIKKNKRRKRKKPISLVTIPGSPLRSKKVTVCKSDFKNYCRRKYGSLNILSAITTEKFEAFPSGSTSESSFVPMIKTKYPDSLSALQFTEHERELRTSETECPSSLFCTLTSESPTLSPVIETELPSTSSVVKSEPYDSSDDSCLDDDILILQMKSNVQEMCILKNVDEPSISSQIKQESLEFLSKSKYVHIDSKCMLNDTHEIENNKKLSNISKPGHLNMSDDYSLCVNINLKSCTALNDSGITSSSSQVKDCSNASANIQKKGKKKLKKCDEGELKLHNLKSQKHKKKQRHDKNEDDISIFLDCDQTQKFAGPCQKEYLALNKNSTANVSKSDIKSIKKHKKSALKSQENVFNFKKLSIAVEAVNKSNNLISKIKTENSPIINQCTCNFPCGLSHLCTCGYYANAKEALSKFKIPLKKKINKQTKNC